MVKKFVAPGKLILTGNSIFEMRVSIGVVLSLWVHLLEGAFRNPRFLLHCANVRRIGGAFTFWELSKFCAFEMFQYEAQ